jgi:hypothetical protein
MHTVSASLKARGDDRAGQNASNRSLEDMAALQRVLLSSSSRSSPASLAPPHLAAEVPPEQRPGRHHGGVAHCGRHFARPPDATGDQQLSQQAGGEG